MSVTISFDKIVKKYEENVVIPELDLQIKPGEFFTLLGPSGCGKTTLLRMIAGFNSIEGGKLSFNDKVMNNIAPAKRNIGMVFQNYAIFPHLNVTENVAFGLQNRKVDKKEIAVRVEEMLKTVQIHQYKDRMPKNLSGGQQQRVALARAIVIKPDVLLMDEPLSNLDAQLRVDMRNAIKQIQQEVGITTVYVTHDQEEAMAVSDRIAVMKLGVIQHVGTPQDIYQRPANIFVATFIGRTNIIDVNISAIEQGKAEVSFGKGYKTTLSTITKTIAGNQTKGKLSVRPEEFIITDETTGLRGKVNHSVFLGLHTHLYVQLENGQNIEIIQQSLNGEMIKQGAYVNLKINEAKVNLYDESGEINLTGRNAL